MKKTIIFLIIIIGFSNAVMMYGVHYGRASNSYSSETLINKIRIINNTKYNDLKLKEWLDYSVVYTEHNKFNAKYKVYFCKDIPYSVNRSFFIFEEKAIWEKIGFFEYFAFPISKNLDYIDGNGRYYIVIYEDK